MQNARNEGKTTEWRRYRPNSAVQRPAICPVCSHSFELHSDLQEHLSNKHTDWYADVLSNLFDGKDDKGRRLKR